MTTFAEDNAAAVAVIGGGPYTPGQVRAARKLAELRGVAADAPLTIFDSEGGCCAFDRAWIGYLPQVLDLETALAESAPW